MAKRAANPAPAEDYVPGVIVDCETGDMHEAHDPDVRKSQQEHRESLAEQEKIRSASKNKAREALQNLKAGDSVNSEDLISLFSHLLVD